MGLGLLGMLFGEAKPVGEGVVQQPRSVHADANPQVICAPVDGSLMALAEVPDPIFASGVMGPGLGIKPRQGYLFSPLNGTVTMTTRTLHAVGLRSDEGVEVLIHVGVDTVDMRGLGFCGFVRQGQHVRAGDPLMAMDLTKIAEAGYSDVVIMVVTNADEVGIVGCSVAGDIAAGERVMTVRGR